MRIILFLLLGLLTGCQSEKNGAKFEQPSTIHLATPNVSKSQQDAFEITTAVRTNGCTLVLYKYAKTNPDLQGFWIQNIFLGNHQLFRVEHSTSPKEQALMFEQMTDVVVMPIDQNLDGKYDTFLILSLKKQKLIDVLMLTDDGWLRHGTEEEYEARQKIAENNQHALERVDKIFQDGFTNNVRQH
jgi:hypothetical protein